MINISHSSNMINTSNATKMSSFLSLDLVFVIRSIMFQISDVTFLVFAKAFMHCPFSNNYI